MTAGSLKWGGKANELVDQIKQYEEALSGELSEQTFHCKMGYFEKHPERMHTISTGGRVGPLARVIRRRE